MQKNIMAIVLLGAMFVAVNVYAKTESIKIMLLKTNYRTGSKTKVFDEQRHINITFLGNGTISVGNLKQQIGKYIRANVPHMPCCSNATITLVPMGFGVPKSLADDKYINSQKDLSPVNFIEFTAETTD